MKTKTEQINQLFDEWEEKINGYKGKFIKDGIIDENLYKKASPKILFIAKEANDPNQTSWDFREWWKQKLVYAFSFRIAEWSYGLLNNFPQYDTIWANKGIAHNAIQYISFMNIKKTGGSGSSKYVQILEHLKMNYNFLHQQINIISPDIIITGTSREELRNNLFPDVNWVNSGYDIAIGRYKNSKVVDFYHPSSRTAPAASYSLLQNIINSDQFKKL